MSSPQNSQGDLALCRRGPKNLAPYLSEVTLNNGVSATSVSEARLDRICLQLSACLLRIHIFGHDKGLRHPTGTFGPRRVPPGRYNGEACENFLYVFEGERRSRHGVVFIEGH